MYVSNVFFGEDGTLSPAHDKANVAAAKINVNRYLRITIKPLSVVYGKLSKTIIITQSKGVKNVKREKLGADEITEKLAELNGWRTENDMLRRKYKFANFAESLDFVNKVGALAEEADHHPDITFGWGHAEIALTTHDRGGVTDVDFALARKIGAIS